MKKQTWIIVCGGMMGRHHKIQFYEFLPSDPLKPIVYSNKCGWSELVHNRKK